MSLIPSEAVLGAVEQRSQPRPRNATRAARRSAQDDSLCASAGQARSSADLRADGEGNARGPAPFRGVDRVRPGQSLSASEAR
jgi:hypothetical protein